MNQQMPEYANWKDSYNKMLESAEELIDKSERDIWCCNEPPDEAGLCPVCREHIN